MIGTFCDPSAISTQNTSEEYRQTLRAECRKSLYFFCKAVLGFKNFTTGIHLPSANFVQDQSYKRKLLMLPRGFMKSHLATIGYSLWIIIQEKDESKGFRGTDERIFIANAVADNAKHFLFKIKSVIERNTVFQWLFPECIPDFTKSDNTWNITEATLPRTTDFPEPTFTAAGVGAAVVSRHFTRIILDDLINEDHVNSPELMRKSIEWYNLVEPLLERTDENEIIVIGTRWAFSDLYSFIEETEGEYSETSPLGYKKYIRSAIEDDKPIFPERFDLRELQRLRDKLKSYLFSCLYLNNPRQPDVNDFQLDWLQYYSFTEKGHCKLTDGRVIDPNDMDRICFVDIATSTRKDADYSAIVTIGVDPARRVFLLEAWRGRVTTKLLIDQILKFARRWHVRCVFYEDSAQQKLIQYPLEERIKETGQYVRVEPIKAGNRQSKENRIRMVSSHFAAKRVYIRESFSDFIREYQDFPLGKHDDLIDAFAYFPRCVRFTYDDIEEPRSEE